MDHTKIDALRVQRISSFTHLIDGRDIAASDGGTMGIISPIDGAVMTTTALGTAAISSARLAVEDGRWCNQPPAVCMMKWAYLIKGNFLHAIEKHICLKTAWIKL